MRNRNFVATTPRAAKRLIALACCCVALVWVTPAAADRDALAADIRQAFQNKTLSLRNPNFGNRLHFNSAGTLVGKSDPGPWSMCGLVEVHKVSLKPDHLEIEGNRVLLILRSASPDNLQMPDPASSPQVTSLITDAKVRISVDLPTSDAAKANEILSHVFQGGPLSARIAGYWQPATKDLTAFRKEHPGDAVGYLEGHRPVYGAFTEIKPPKLTHDSEPTYTEQARKDRLQGTTILAVIVNEQGYPEVLQITHGLEEGLDIQAFAAVAEWKFKPAMKDGIPVSALITVQVNFRLN